MTARAVYVYRLVVEIPPECSAPDFVPDELREKEEWRDWDSSPFKWPRRHLYLDWTAAANRAAMLRRWGAKVRVERARVEDWVHAPVWPETVAEKYTFVRDLTDREIADEIALDPPLEEHPRSEAYLFALCEERDRRQHEGESVVSREDGVVRITRVAP